MISNISISFFLPKFNRISKNIHKYFQAFSANPAEKSFLFFTNLIFDDIILFSFDGRSMIVYLNTKSAKDSVCGKKYPFLLSFWRDAVPIESHSKR